MLRRISLLTVVVIVAITVMGVVRVFAQSPMPPNLDDYCKSLGYLGVKQDPTQPNNPYGKGCVRPDGTMVGIDMQAACRWQYGDALPVAQYPDSMKPDWLCYPSADTAPKPPPPMTPMPQPTAVPQLQPTQPPPPPPPPQQPGSNAKFPDAQEPSGPGVYVPITCKHWGHIWSSNEPGDAYG